MNTTAAIWSTTAVLAPSFPFNESEIILVATTLFTLCTLGTVANVLTFFVIGTSKQLKSTFYLLMMSLCVSDFMSAINSILFVYSITWGYNNWEWSTALCKIFFGIDIGTSYVTSVHILMFAIFRFVSIQWPIKFKLFTTIHGKVCICIVWAVCLGTSFLLSISWLGAFPRKRIISSVDVNWPSCSADVKSASHIVLYVAVAYPIFYYTPLVLVVLFSIGIALKVFFLKKKRMALKGTENKCSPAAEIKRQRKEKQILLQLGLIVGSFLMGYVPQTAYHFYVNDPSTPSQPRTAWLFSFLAFLTLRISECFNPIFYNLSSSKMRKETKETLQAIWFKFCSCRHREITVKM